jgi:hypothetical protein
MSLDGVQHYRSLLENPLSSRLCNYTTTVSLSLAARTRSLDWGEVDDACVVCSQKDEATASILKLLTNLSQIELDLLSFSTPGRIVDGWQWWPKTIATLVEEIGCSTDADADADGGTSRRRPFIRALALHAIRPSMDPLIAQILTALTLNLNALVLATDSNHIYKANDGDFVASWASIQRYAANLATLVVSGIPVTAPNGSWACSRSLRNLDITSAPALTPTLAYEFICQFPALRNVTLRSIRLKPPSPRDNPDVSTRTMLPAADVDATTPRPFRNSISLQNLSLASLDIDFAIALSSLGTTTLHLQVIHRSSSSSSSSGSSPTLLLHLLKQPGAFVGMSRLVVGNNSDGGGRRVLFGWLGAKETEELRAICKERGCTFEDERFSGTR